MQIHIHARQGNIEGVAQEIANGVEIDCLDPINSLTPLMYAVTSNKAGVELVRFLVDNGANVDAIESKFQQPVLGLAVGAGNLPKIRLLLNSGANISYQRPHGYDVLIDAMHGRDIARDKNLLSILGLLLERGAQVDGISSYGETALKIASRVGRFDAVHLLLKAGCDRTQLQWTTLMYAIVFGRLEDVDNLLNNKADLNTRDFWQRTPWLLSIEVGDIDKAKLILASAANPDDRGQGGRTALMYAIEHNHFEILNWLIAEGFDIEARDEYEPTPLMTAAETGATDCAKILLETGANPSYVSPFYEKAIKVAADISIVRMLVEVGEDLSEINEEMRRTLTGVSNCDLEVSQKHYYAGKHRRFGTSNPEIITIDFWQAMIRCGWSAWQAKSAFEDINSQEQAVWCYQRFGRTITELPDGRIIEIAGEHEDYYDPDFCIYNDVVVYKNKGDFEVYSYPRNIFPPTDFHSATLVEEYIYVIGNLGYINARRVRETPVYKLHCQSFKIEKVDTTGNKPGWISRHRASYHEPSNAIHVSGGVVWQTNQNKSEYVDNYFTYTLNLTNLAWTQIDN